MWGRSFFEYVAECYSVLAAQRVQQSVLVNAQYNWAPALQPYRHAGAGPVQLVSACTSGVQQQ